MNKNKKYLIFVFLIIAQYSIWTNADTPLKYSICEQTAIAPENSNGHFFDSKYNLYILPPKVGKVKVTNYSMSVSPDLCSGTTPK